MVTFDNFTVDGTLIEASASTAKSQRRKRVRPSTLVADKGYHRCQNASNRKIRAVVTTNLFVLDEPAHASAAMRAGMASTTRPQPPCPGLNQPDPASMLS